MITLAAESQYKCNVASQASGLSIIFHADLCMGLFPID